jgi:hypothetical protein
MEKDFHYYAVHKLAELAGFARGDAETIAYASQYVDNATESEPIEPYPDQQFDTVRTAHYLLEAFDWDVQKKIYMPFHFLPAHIRWKSPKDFSYVTQAAIGDDSELATMLVKEALGEQDAAFRLIRLGIALHTVADTFSHFGFSGRNHKENSVGDIWRAVKGRLKFDFTDSFFPDMIFPRIGHLRALRYPDYPYLEWQYTDSNNNKKKRINLDYSLEGAKLLYRFLKTAKTGSGMALDLERDQPNEFVEIKHLFENNGTEEERCEKWRDYTKATEYDKIAWRNEALSGRLDWDDKSPAELKVQLREVKGKTGFENSKWVYFHRAAHKQRSLVVGWLN